MDDGMEIRLNESTSELRRLAAELESFCEAHQLPERVSGALALALEEAVTNILMYAFEGHHIRSRCGCCEHPMRCRSH